MKRIKSTIQFVSFMLCAPFVSAQHLSPIGVQGVVQPAPESAKFVNYYYTPMNTSTGNASIEIPIYDISIDGIQIPISLTYNTSGIRVTDLSGSVGLGWSLNAGGGIYRSINGRADEKSNNASTFLNQSVNPSNYHGSPYQDLMIYENQVNLQSLAKNELDLNQDDYTYNFLDRSGSIYFNAEKKFVESINSNTAFDYNSVFLDTISAHDADGNVFYFSDKDNSSSFFINYPSSNVPPDVAVDGAVSWRLSRINTVHNRSVSFSYMDYFTDVSYPIANSIIKYGATFSGTSSGCYDEHISKVRTDIRIQTRNRVVKEIYSDNVRVVFTYSENAQASGWKLKLDKVEIIDPVSGNAIKTAVLSYSLFGGDPRLRLDEVVLYGSGNQDPYKYVLNYSNMHLPSINTMAKDIFGYYNGASNSTLLKLADGSLTANGFTSTDYSANRNVNSVNIMMGTLMQITFPTGGTKKFFYEPNYSNGKYAPGIRLQKIETYSAQEQLAGTRTFTYSGPVGRFVVLPDVSVPTRVLDQQMFIAGEDFNYSSERTAQLSQLPKNFFYAKVEIKDVGYGNDTSTTIDYYKDPNGDGGGDHTGLMLSNGHYNTKLYKQEFFKDNLEPNNLVKRSVYNYASRTAPENKETIWKMLPSYLGNYYLSDGALWTCFEFYEGVDRLYELQSKWILLDSEEQIDYKDGLEVLNDSRSFEYADGNHLPSKVVYHQSNGQDIVHNYSYSKDFDFIPTATLNAYQKGISNLKNRGIKNALIEEYVQVSEPNSGSYKIVAAKLNSYKENVPYVDAVYALKSSQGVGFVPQLDHQASQGISSYYESRLNYTLYDAYANPLEIIQVGGAVTSNLWSYGGRYPVAEINNAVQSDVAYAGFESEGKGNWTYSGATVADATAPGGRRAYNLSGGQLQKSGLAAAGYYVLTYWAKSGATATVSISTGGTLSAAETVGSRNGWTCYRRTVSGATWARISGSGSVDEVRLHPREAQMTTYTHDPLIGMTSQTDASGRTTYYEYDGFGRLRAVRDPQGNLTGEYQYHYMNQ